MKSGKVSNTMLKRSVLKLIKRREEILHGPDIGIDSAEVTGHDNCNMVSAVSSSEYAVYRVVNNIAVSGGRCIAVMCAIMMPEDFDEHVLKFTVKQVESQCEELGISIAGGSTLVSGAVSEPIITITGLGAVEKGRYRTIKNALPEEDIVAAGCIGTEGIRIISRQKQEEILKWYRQNLIDTACGNMEDLSVVKKSAIAAKAGVISMSDVSEGGIFASLWNMSEASGVGFEVDFKKIPVKQEMIEICELFDINPYELMSSGCLLMTSKHGYDIVKMFHEVGIEAAVIGRTTAGNDKIIMNDGEIRYLDPPKRDEVYKIY